MIGRRHLVVAAATLLASALGPGCFGGGESLAAKRFVSPSGLDSGSCKTRGKACRSFGHAYTQAGPGDVVEVAAGSYPPQTIPRIQGRRPPRVEFRPAPGARVQVADLVIAGDYVTVRGLLTAGVDVNAGGPRVRGVRVIGVHARRAWITNADSVRFSGGSYGGNVNSSTVEIHPPATHLLFNRVTFHDARITDPGAHMECIWANGVQHFTVRNSRFRNCAIMDLFLTRFDGPNPKDVLLENNVFETPRAYGGGDAFATVNVAGFVSRMENFTFRNNTFASDVSIQPHAIVHTKLVGNLGEVSSCKRGVKYSHNVFTGARCSRSDRRARRLMSQFVNPARHNWRLRRGAAAIDAGDPEDFPHSDLLGRRRRGRPDAGALEYIGRRRSHRR